MNNNVMEQLHECIGKIERDSREVKPGQIYIAIKGENHDGHDFLEEAFKNGASKAIVEKEIEGIDKDKFIVVEDTLAILNQLAIYVRSISKAKFIGITGSSGKTSTKELLKAALEIQGKTYATVGNMNNLIGLPITLVNMPLDIDYVILEMGMNHSGEIEQLTKIAKPDVAIITNIGRAHHGFFKTTNDIALAKSEIFQGLNKDGIAVIAKGEFFNLLNEKANEYSNNILVLGDDNDLKLLNYNNGDVKCEINGKEYCYSLLMKGEHQALNSVMVLGAVDALGVDVNAAIKGISKLNSLKGRGETKIINTKFGEFTLIDDAYNANPDSMTAAFKVLGSYKDKRKVAILGEMRELGEFAKTLHEGLLSEILNAQIDKVYCCCNDIKSLFDMLPEQIKGEWAEDSKKLKELLDGEIENEDVILVKGSLGSNMLLIVDWLKSLNQD